MRVGGLVVASTSRAVRREWDTKGPKKLPLRFRHGSLWSRYGWCIAEVGQNPLNYNFLAAQRRLSPSAATSRADDPGRVYRPRALVLPAFVRFCSALASALACFSRSRWCIGAIRRKGLRADAAQNLGKWPRRAARPAPAAPVCPYPRTRPGRSVVCRCPRPCPFARSCRPEAPSQLTRMKCPP